MPKRRQMFCLIFDQILDVMQFNVSRRHYTTFNADSWPFDVKTYPLANIRVYGEHINYPKCIILCTFILLTKRQAR